MEPTSLALSPVRGMALRHSLMEPLPHPSGSAGEHPSVSLAPGGHAL